MSTGIKNTLILEQLNSIIGDLQIFRLDNFIQELNKVKGTNVGKVLPFVRGLRFSALLIYKIREALSSTDLEVNWGHIIDEEGKYCSRESDIIIHKKGHCHKWNGTENHIMDFRFIEKEKAITVISCKSFIRKSDIDKTYVEEMETFVSKLWLFAECCGPKSDESIRNESIKYGYEHFFYLYTYIKSTNEIKINEEGWLHFIEEVKKLVPNDT